MNANLKGPPRSGRRRVASAAAIALLAVAPAVARAQSSAAPATAATQPTIRVVTDESGSRLQVNGADFMVHGMNWDYIPIGQNYSWNLWSQPDDVIEAALAREMPLLHDMGINAVRQYAGVPPRWVKYIYERYGIFTVINHTVGRYGFTLHGVWHPSVDYSDPALRAAIKAEVVSLVDEFRGTPGVLMWLLGNENNYGLSWTSNEIEALPQGEREAVRARYLYSLFGEIVREMKQHDPGVPVAMANGDLQYIDIVAEECKGLDIMGANVYRGISARDLFQVVKNKLGLPFVFTEFGSDAYNAKEMHEDQSMQARYLLGQWEEIYEQSSGKGRVGNAIGGFIFQWSDGWWKFGQDKRLDIHDDNASWPNGGYTEDYVPGENNMNEEWWGICAKGPPDNRGLFQEYPRAAFFALRQAFTLPAYAPGTDLATIRAHFAAIQPVSAELEARGDQASLITEALSRVQVTGLRMRFQTFSTGGQRLSTPKASSPATTPPAFRGFDRMESYYADFKAEPTQNVVGTLSLSMLGNVARNPIDEIFYENRGRPVTLLSPSGPQTLDGVERIKVYQASVSWNDRWFLLDGFYRTGHYHWGYEGDLFGLYREANYGPNIDTYNADAPTGFEIEGKRLLTGLKLAYGPQIWWGANPSLMFKYRRRVAGFDATAIYQKDLTEQTSLTSSSAVPLPPTQKATLALSTTRGPFVIEVGGIWSGDTKVGQPFQVARMTPSGYVILADRVRASDAFGMKGKVSLAQGRCRWYAQSTSMRPVADGGPTAVQNFTGWDLKDSGSGNQNNFLTGFTLNTGDFQIGPNFLWQKPIIGPMPNGLPAPGRLRNTTDDPFAVRANRETVGGELVVTYDPTPATWLWAWDNDIREDAPLAGSLGLVYRHLPTNMDAAIGILADGVTRFAFPASTPPRDLWELNARLVSRLSPRARLLAHVYAGTGEPNGDSPRLIHRYGVDTRLAWGSMAFSTSTKVNDWGPYDYHRDFNLTFPLQLMGDVSHTLGSPRWFSRAQTQLGVRATWRSLDVYSPRFVPDPGVDPASSPHGREWELRTYLELAL